VAQNAIFAVLPVKFNFCQKKSAAKFVCVKTSSSKDVAASFLYLMVHSWIAGDIPIYLYFALKVTHLFRKHQFRQISLNSAGAVRSDEKFQLLLIGSRQCGFHRVIDEIGALPLSPPMGALKVKTRNLHLALPFIASLQVIVDTSNLVCGLKIVTPSLQITNRP